MTLECDDWWREHLRHYSSHLAYAGAKKIEEAILGTGVSKVNWNEKCRCGQSVTVATLDAFKKSKTGLLWRHKDSNDCIAFLNKQLVDLSKTHQLAINRQADSLAALARRVDCLEKRRWWQL